MTGALSVTAAVGLLVYALAEAADVGWTSAQTIVLFLASAGHPAAIAAVEQRSPVPLGPFSIFRVRSLSRSNVSGLALSGSLFGTIFVLILNMQQVLGHSPLRTGSRGSPCR